MRFCTFRPFPAYRWRYFLLVEGVVESEGVVLHVFGDAIYLVLGLMNFDLRVGTRNRVYLTALFLFLEDWSLADADCQLNGERRTLSSLELVCGERSFSLKRLFSIMSSKSMSTFFPLCRL